MEINEILCKKTGKIIKAEKIYKVNSHDESLETIVTYCSMCPHSETSKNKICKNCYGTIAQSRKRVKTKNGKHFQMNIENYTNTFKRNEEKEFIRDMSADDFMDNIDIVANMNSNNWNHGQRVDDGLRAYDRPKTWKTDCAECKLKYAEKKELTPCQKAKKFYEDNGIDIKFASEKQIVELELPQECVCQEQTQTLYFV